MSTDGELLAAWQAGDQSAGERLFDRHFERLYRFFWNKVGDGAEDLVQQTMLGALEARERFRGEASFSTFLMSIARRRLFSHWEQRSRRASIDFSLTSVADLATSPSSILAREQDLRALLDALRSIPLDDQILLELHYWEKLPGPELARVFEVPEGTVRSRLRAARGRLKAVLERGAVVTDASTNDLEAWAQRVRSLAAGHDE